MCRSQSIVVAPGDTPVVLIRSESESGRSLLRHPQAQSRFLVVLCCSSSHSISSSIVLTCTGYGQPLAGIDLTATSANHITSASTSPLQFFTCQYT